MTDKEQIIIDGVDITECDYFSMGLTVFKDYCTLYPHGTRCSENKDCYFKQLARKTQECEELKLKCLGNRNDYLCERQVTKRYRRALEEIEEIINNILNSCLGRNTAGCRPAHNICGDLIKILDIINKAKGEGND